MGATPTFEYPEIELRHVRVADDGEQEWEFCCECGEKGCKERVFLTLDAYIAIHDGRGVVLADGHRQSEIDRARRLREDADALTRQAEHQTKRARRNMRLSRIWRRNAR